MTIPQALKKILIVWQAKYPWEVRIEKEVESLLAAGVQVSLLARQTFDSTGKPEPVEETLEMSTGQLRIYRCHSVFSSKLTVPISGNPVWTRAIRGCVRREHPDMIVVRDIPLSLSAIRVAREAGLPIVMDMAEHYPGAMRSWRKYQTNPLSKLLIHDLKLPDRIEAKAVTQMDGILTVCQEQNERLIRDYGYPAQKLQIVNNSPKRAWFEEAKCGHASPPRVLGHHGHMTPERGLNLLLDAFAMVLKTHPEFELHLAGAGECQNEVAETAKRLGVSGRIRMTGRFAHGDLVRMYGETDIAILPYPPGELIDHTLSNKIFDYMSCGKPIISSHAKPMKRLLSETGAGTCFEPWTAAALVETLDRVLSKGELSGYARAGRRAFEETYHWEVDAGRMIAFLDRIVRDHAMHPGA
jgi:glycosyltransferase involved in cell wall biosynthesis